MKKVLSLVLVIAMVLSSMSFAFASPLTDIADNDYEDAINTLVGLGIIDGYEDGTFRPERTVTRAQMAKMLVITLGYGDLVAGSKSNFADTQGHWADAYIALASGQGLVIGYPNGTFQPDKTIAYDEVMTMVVRSLGYTDGCNEIVGTWPTNYKIKAAQLGLTDDVKLLAVGADRGGVAQLLKNALSAVLVKVDTDGDVSYVKDADDENKSLLSRLATKAPLTVSADSIDVDHKDYKGDIVDLTPYMYQNVVVYENKDGDVVYVDDVKSLTFEGTVTATTTASITVENADGDDYDFKTTTHSSIEFMYNGEEAEGKYDPTLVEDAEVTVVLNADSDDKIKNDVYEVAGIIVEKVSGYVQVEEEYVDGELVFDALYLPEDDDEVDFANLTITGDATSLEDIQEDDVISVFVPLDGDKDDYFYKEAADKMMIVVSRNTVDGKVTKINSDGDVYISGTSYEVNPDGDVIAVADEGTFYLDHAGKIFAVDTENNSEPEDFAVVLDVINGYQSEYVAGKSQVRLAEPKVKLLTAKGEEITYVLDDEDDSLLTVVPNTTSQTINVVLSEGALIKYNVNSDGEVDEIVAANLNENSAVDIKTDSNSFNLASNVAIFSLPNYAKADKVEDAKVVKAEDLDSEDIKGLRVYDGNKIVALIVTEGAVEDDDIFAIVTGNKATGYDEDEDKAVTLYTAFVNGVKVEYLKHKDATGGTVAISDEVVALTLKDGKLVKATGVDSARIVTGTAINSRVTISITDGKGTETTTDDVVRYLADDVVIYVVESDGDVVVGSKSDIRNNDFKAYDTTKSVDGDYDVVVVYEAGL